MRQRANIVLDNSGLQNVSTEFILLAAFHENSDDRDKQSDIVRGHEPCNQRQCSRLENNRSDDLGLRATPQSQRAAPRHFVFSGGAGLAVQKLHQLFNPTVVADSLPIPTILRTVGDGGRGERPKLVVVLRIEGFHHRAHAVKVGDCVLDRWRLGNVAKHHQRRNLALHVLSLQKVKQQVEALFLDGVLGRGRREIVVTEGAQRNQRRGLVPPSQVHEPFLNGPVLRWEISRVDDLEETK